MYVRMYDICMYVYDVCMHTCMYDVCIMYACMFMCLSVLVVSRHGACVEVNLECQPLIASLFKTVLTLIAYGRLVDP